MDQFNSDTYKKQGIVQEFFNSCLGKIVIFLGVLLCLYIFALITVPSKELMFTETLDYPGFKTIHVVNSMYPEGLRIGIGLFQNVISTLHYGDLVLSNGAARGDYNKKLTAPIEMPEDDEDYEETHVEPYHYDGDPDN